MSKIEWISVGDSLPMVNEWVLFWHAGHGNWHIGWLYDYNKAMWTTRVFSPKWESGAKGVSHWMPLPKPPTTNGSGAEG